MNDTTKPITDYPHQLRHVENNVQKLAAAQPAVMEKFEGLHMAGVATRALDRKTKELIALAVSVVVRCDDCIPWHVRDSLKAGASREEITDAIGVAILMGGGPAMLYACHAIEALDQFLARATGPHRD
jgi:AhpD family alkylhydroperoxidase